MDTNACFFSLLKAGLWGTHPDESFFEEGRTAWEEIISLSVTQTVAALVFDGMEMLPSNLRPPRPLFMKWFALVTRIEQTNDKLNRELAALQRLYNKHDIPFVLLKGQGCASIYPRPEHRQCGDLDLYIGRKNYDKVNNLIAGLGLELKPETEKHIGFVYKDVYVENHRYAARFYSPVQNRKLQRFANEWLNSPGKIWAVYDTGISLPAPGFNVIYLLVHTLLHFISGGVGLRQVCDWTCTLKVYAGEIDRDRLLREIKLLKLDTAFAAFGYVAVKYMGLPAEYLPLSVDKASDVGEFLLSDILRGGNFGIGHGKDEHRPKSRWKGKLYSFRYICNRCREMSLLYPPEARWYPYSRVVNLVYKITHGMD